MSQHSEALYRSVVAVDVVGFTDPRRTYGDQLTVHTSLAVLLEQAFNEAGIDWASCEVEDRGDGKLILVPPSVPRIRLADSLWSRLLTGLRRHNATHPDTASMQLRVALHTGDVRSSSIGKVSPAINFAFRILDAPDAKASLVSTNSILALIASEEFFHDVIEHDQAAEPDSFQRIPMEVKETRTAAWLRLSNQAESHGVLPPLVVVTEPSRSAHAVSSDAELDRVIAVDAYLATNDEAVARRIMAALDDIARVLGYDAPYDEEFRRGSFRRRAKAWLRNGITSEEVRTRLIKLERSIELAGIDAKQAEVDSKSAEAVRQLIDSLAQVPEACMQVGSILLIKYQAGNVPVILTRRLSQIEIRALEHYPEIQTKPRQVLEALSTAIASIEPGADDGRAS